MRTIHSIQVVGINGDRSYEDWKSKISQAIVDLYLPVKLEEVNKVDAMINYNLSSIPALLVDGNILLQQNSHIPKQEEINTALEEYLKNEKWNMKNIIIPTDFSDNAKNAYDYAEALAEDMGSHLKVIHVCHPTTDVLNGIVVPVVDELIELRREQLANFVQSEKSSTMEGAVAQGMVEQEVVLGFASDELVRRSKDKEMDLIVMGTRGKGGILERAFGSVSSSVSQKADCPVWLVPPGVKYKGINNILYASDYHSADQEMVQKIIDLAASFDANVHLVHVNENKKKGDVALEELVLEKLFTSKTHPATLRLSTVESDRVWDGLFEYAEKEQIDLIVVVTQHRSFWESIRHKSITKDLVFHAKVPLLVMHINE